MTEEALKEIEPAVVVDARGVSCPGPILAAKKQIATVPLGDVMAVLSTDSGSLKDIPAWSGKMGHEYLGAFEDAGVYNLFVRRSK